MDYRNVFLLSWKQKKWWNYALYPVSLVYGAAIYLRRKAYQTDFFYRYRAPCPVIVVGNLSVGGTGKTPLVIALYNYLKQQGFNPGIISRGYHSQAKQYPLIVTPKTEVIQSGDEPALIVQKTQSPLAIGANRQASIDCLLSKYQVDVIISDDGLQHLALQQDIRVCLVDNTTETDNYFLLPAGPYRESFSKIEEMDFVIEHQQEKMEKMGNGVNVFTMQLCAQEAIAVTVQTKKRAKKINKTQKVHAVAGIGNPRRFFNTCQASGFDIIPHAFDDHHAFTPRDIQFDDELAVLMTEKDAIKCKDFTHGNLWCLPVEAKLNTDFFNELKKKVSTL